MLMLMTFLSHFSFSSRRAAVMMMGLKIDNNVITTSSHTYVEFYFIKKSVPADFRRPASPLDGCFVGRHLSVQYPVLLLQYIFVKSVTIIYYYCTTIITNV